MKFPAELNSFFKKQFNYLISKDYCFYFEGSDNSSSNQKYSFGIVHKDNFEQITPSQAGRKIFSVTDFQYYFSLINNHNNNYYKSWSFKNEDHNSPTWQAIKHIYTNYPEERKTIVTFFDSISNTPLNKCFEEFFDLFCNNKKDIVNLIKSFPKTSLGINTIKLESLDQYLFHNGFTPVEIDKFFLSYFKNRETRLNLPDNFPQARDFLLQKYQNNDEKLTPYFAFFPALKNEFQDVDYSGFLLPMAKHSVVLDVDLKACMQTFLIDNWDIYDYRASVTNFRIALGRYFEVQNDTGTEPIGTKDILRLTFIHDNEKFTQKLANETIIDYFLYLKSHPEFKKSNIDDHKKWIAQYILSKNIEHVEKNNNTAIKKNKI